MTEEKQSDSETIKILPPLQEISNFLVPYKQRKLTPHDSIEKHVCNVKECEREAEYTIGIIIPKNWLEHTGEKELIPTLHYTCKEHRAHFVDKIQKVAPKAPSVSIFDVSEGAQKDLSRMLSAIISETDLSEYFIMTE